MAHSVPWRSKMSKSLYFRRFSGVFYGTAVNNFAARAGEVPLVQPGLPCGGVRHVARTVPHLLGCHERDGWGASMGRAER